MSTIGRVFIVLNLVLSAAFLGWAANALSKARHYQEEIAKANTDHAAAISEKEGELKKIQGDLSAVTEEQRKLREQRDAFETESNRLKTQVDEAKRTGDAMQATLTKIQATLGDYNNSITQLTQQKDAAIKQAHEADTARATAVAEKDAAVMAQRDAEEASKNAQTKISDLEGEKKTLSEKVDDLDTRLTTVMAKTGLAAKDVMAQPRIDALVLDVNKDLKLVVLNKGKKDDVKVGYVFDVYRGSQYKGQVRVTDVQDGMSSGLIVNEKTAIGRGDSASTVL